MSKQELAQKIRELSMQMSEVATLIDYYGGFDAEMQQHAAELMGAALIAETWAEGIEEDEK